MSAPAGGGVDERFGDSKSPSLPPVFPFVLGVLLAVVAVHILGEQFFAFDELWEVIASDALIVVTCGGIGWIARSSMEGTTRGRAFERWEATFGTRGAASVCLLLSMSVLYVAIRFDREWLGLAGMCAVVAGYAAATARDHTMLEPGEVILSGEQPENIEDYIRCEFEVGVPSRTSAATEVKRAGVWISKQKLKDARNRNRGTEWQGGSPMFDRYVEESWEVHELADRLVEIARGSNLDRLGEVKLALSLVEKIPYSFDIDSTGKEDYWRYPIETLADGTGDCEDFAILAVALLSAMGHRTCFFDIPGTLIEAGHAAMGVAELPEDVGESFEAADKAHFAYVETTSEGFRIGELPAGITRDKITIGKIVAPLKSRMKANDLQVVGLDEWRMDERILLVGSVLIAAVGAALGLALRFTSLG